MKVYINYNKRLVLDNFFFNAGEFYCKLSPESIELLKIWGYDVVDIYFTIQNGNDLLKLLGVIDAIRRTDKVVNRSERQLRIHLHTSYFPGGRQDRVCNLGESLTVKIYADIINSLNCDSIEICDPHSDVTPALLNNCKLYPIENIIDKAIDSCQPDFIISPDAGATKKIENYLKKLNCNLPVIQCLKKRDTKTGKLSEFQICGGPEWSQPKSTRMLMIDDIGENCGTHIGLAKEWKDLHPKNELYLYITHAILPKKQENLDNLFQYFEKVYTTDSFSNGLNSSNRFIIYTLYETT